MERAVSRKVGRGKAKPKLISKGTVIGRPFDRYGLSAKVNTHPNGSVTFKLTEVKGKEGSFATTAIPGLRKGKGRVHFLTLNSRGEGNTISRLGAERGYELIYQRRTFTYRECLI